MVNFKSVIFYDQREDGRVINLDSMVMRGSLAKNYKKTLYHQHVPPPCMRGSELVYTDYGHHLYQHVYDLIFKHNAAMVQLPYGAKITVKIVKAGAKAAAKAERTRARLVELFNSSGQMFTPTYKFLPNRLFGWHKTGDIDTEKWVKGHDKILQKIRYFELLAFDFETHPGPGPRCQQPVMVCLTKYDCATKEIANLKHFIGTKCHYALLQWLMDRLCSCPGSSQITIIGFNSSKFDNIFIAAALSIVTKDKRMGKPKYLESKGRIIDITIKTKKTKDKASSALSFRDVLQYFPVGNRGSLKNMAKNFKLEELKDVCSLEDMVRVGDMIIDYEEENPDVELPLEGWPDPFQAELKYCYQDTRVLYGLAKYMGDVLSAVPGPRKAYFALNPLVPVHFAYLVQFLTLPQAAFKFLPHIFEDEELTEEFSYVTDTLTASFCQRSISGGRTLCGTIGQVYPTISTDICSEYPAAMCGPMPGGEAFHLSIGQINDLNILLATDRVFQDPLVDLTKVFPIPFIALCYIYKERDYNQHYADGVHSVIQTIPFVPYRECSYDYVTSVLPPGGKPPLNWIADTNDQVLRCVYNCVDVFMMRRLGFHVSISTAVRPLGWPEWNLNLERIYSSLFKKKAAAKKEGDKALELAVKILLNSSIGKFGQRIVEGSSFDGITFTKKGTGKNRTLFHLNSFCMSMSRVINQCHQSLVCYGNHIPTWKWDTSRPVNTPVFYGDTDNLVFLPSAYQKIHDHMAQANLFPQLEFLAKWIYEGSYFHMTLEFEEWHSCDSLPYKGSPIISNSIFLGKKSYIMGCMFCGKKLLAEMNALKTSHPEWKTCKNDDCTFCPKIKKIRDTAFRLKAKGHAKSGIFPEDFAPILFADPPLPTNYFIPSGESYNALETTFRIFKYIYPEKTEHELRNMTSGKRFTFNVRLASSGKFSLIPTNIERKYCASIPANQERCTLCFAIRQK
jgi:hypothetical protein